MSHNKKRNTAFLFETLSREGTKAIFEKDMKRATFVKNLLVKYFSNNTEMSRELQLYKNLETNSIDSSIADRYLQEVKKLHDKLDKKKIFNEQSSLIGLINKFLGAKVYNNFVPNYKNIATISQIFNDKTPIKDKILLEQTFVGTLSNKEQEKEMKPVDNIVYKTFTNKFNEKYSGLLSEQKNLLSKYVSSFTDDGLELKIFLNEEIGRLKESVNAALKIDEISKDAEMKTKSEQVEQFLKTFKDAKEISKDMLEKVLKIQQFVHEVNK